MQGLVLISLLVVLLILMIYQSVSIQKYTRIPNKDTGLIDMEPTKDDPLMNNAHPVLKRLPEVYTAEEHNKIEGLMYENNGDHAENYHNYAFTRNFHTEPAEDFEAYKDFLGYNRTGPDFYPEKISYITALND